MGHSNIQTTVRYLHLVDVGAGIPCRLSCLPPAPTTVPEQHFFLDAEVSSHDPKSIEPILRSITGLRVTPLVDGFHIEGAMVGQSARDLNRSLLSALRGVERRTRIRSQWTLGDATFRFFDYVPKS